MTPSTASIEFQELMRKAIGIEGERNALIEVVKIALGKNQNVPGQPAS